MLILSFVEINEMKWDEIMTWGNLGDMMSGHWSQFSGSGCQVYLCYNAMFENLNLFWICLRILIICIWRGPCWLNWLQRPASRAVLYSAPVSTWCRTLGLLGTLVYLERSCLLGANTCLLGATGIETDERCGHPIGTHRSQRIRIRESQNESEQNWLNAVAMTFE